MKSKSFDEAKFEKEVQSWKTKFRDLAEAMCSEMVVAGAEIDTAAAELPDDAAAANDFEEIAKNGEADFWMMEKKLS